MENNYETLRMPELKALARERKLRGYSRLRKAELIAFLQDEDRRQEEPHPRTGIGSYAAFNAVPN